MANVRPTGSSVRSLGTCCLFPRIRHLSHTASGTPRASAKECFSTKGSFPTGVATRASGSRVPGRESDDTDVSMDDGRDREARLRMLATENRRRRERPAVVRDLAERLGFEPSLDDFLALDAYIL